jgi:hypothetical protein
MGHLSNININSLPSSEASYRFDGNKGKDAWDDDGPISNLLRISSIRFFAKLLYIFAAPFTSMVSKCCVR